MTDKDVLKGYRLKQAEETLFEAQKMLDGGFTSRTIISRAYYSMFYAVLALFLDSDLNIKTSKHMGVISVFDKEFIKTGKLDKRYSEMIHEAFDARLECDYKDFVEATTDEATSAVQRARDFINAIKTLIQRM